MKKVPVFSSKVMSIECPYCGVPGKIKKDLPPDKDFSVHCPKCDNKFLISINKRKFYRREVSIPLYFSHLDIDDPFDEKSRKGKILNISKTGVYFESRLSKQSLQIYKKKVIITLLFSLEPGQKLLKIKGEITGVVVDKTVKIGIQFIDLDPHQNKLIGFYLMK